MNRKTEVREYLESQIIHQQGKIVEANAIIKALQMLLKETPGKSNTVKPENGSSILVPDKNQAQTIPQKVVYALAMVKKGTAHDVAGELIHLFPDKYKDEKKALYDARYHLSKLFNAHIGIAAESAGKGRQYVYIYQKAA